MNSFQLECFIAVANALNFAHAAKKMNVSQPAVTHQIKSLEDELGTKLFYRSTRYVELTAEGRAFVADAKSMLALESQAKMRFRSAEKPIETISVGCGNYIQLAMLSTVLTKLKEETPNLHPKLEVAPYEQLFRQMEIQRIDLIFGINDSHLSHQGIKYTELLQSDAVCVSKADRDIASKDTVNADDLRCEQLIFCDPMSLSPEMANFQLQLAQGKNLTDIQFCSSSAESYVLARSGFGVAILPDLLVPNDPATVKIKTENAPKLSFGLFSDIATANKIVKRFIAIAANAVSDKKTSPFSL